MLFLSNLESIRFLRGHLLLRRSNPTFLNKTNNRLIRIVPQLARVIRILRITRLLKLVKSFKNLRQILETLIIAVPALLNVMALLTLVLFIYSILGCFIFGNVTEGQIIED